MKKLEFETSKGKFVLVDRNNDEFLELICKYEPINIKQITEEQASEIVDYGIEEVEYQGGGLYNTYYNYKKGCFDLGDSNIESLHTLFEELRVHLFKNPVPEPEYITDNFGNGGVCEHWVSAFQEQEQNTFYNPYIFKI